MKFVGVGAPEIRYCRTEVITLKCANDVLVRDGNQLVSDAV